ncbi:MAG: S1 RNA-binding domain-containing protein [Caldilineae bacterium]|nr:S1 RNA-binding domain-containing protein [Anaerolineae bacterium]MCB0201261.1 S1 RNA-binding domain-containing protein [Anaerolineae bacterium]MCB0204918.1 S1 RNA-binding domain-containing protein [Anaerolineae bacterium]MCB0256161.1 S1 RNA-binding domain-containing protein [Anaerolineae bacterium]MCB9155218.1 S1 RNA-binding domain-containing protein [Caldilineae bacterium]
MEYVQTGNRSRQIGTPLETIQEDDGYWEALLTYGEIVTQDAPPPWISNSPANGNDGLGRTDEELSAEEKDWQHAEQLSATQSPCCLVVTGYNRGGLLVNLGCLSGFVPGSHLLDFPVNLDYDMREEALARRIGEKLKLQVIEIDRLRSRLVLSERVACVEERSESLFARLHVGDVVRGQVSNLRRFGAFVDLGGYEGLLHISELSWGRVNDPSDVVQVGQEIQVYVLDINHEERKIQLSLKHLQADPWQGVSQRYTIGDVVSGEVTNVVNFGAFTRLEDGVEGLIHISELAEGTFLHPRNVVSEGQQVRVRVLAVDPVHRRIGLSLRQAREARHTDAYDEWS